MSDDSHLQRSLLNSFTDSGLDRAALKRKDVEWLASRRLHGESRYLLLDGDQCLVAADGSVCFSAADLGIRDTGDDGWVFLGIDAEGPVFSLDVGLETHRYLDPEDMLDRRDLRTLGYRLPAVEAARVAYAKAILLWHRRHGYCGICGSVTRSADGGHLRVCSNEACGVSHFPRTDPAVIVRVTCAGRMLLGRAPTWPERRYSVLAGFVEPGETLEHAVVREVFEETGVEVVRAHYHSSQPWPFPASVMIGYGAEASSEALILDNDEIVQACWVSHSELEQAVLSDEIKLSPPLSISFRLMEDWYKQAGGDLRDLVKRADAGSR